MTKEFRSVLEINVIQKASSLVEQLYIAEGKAEIIAGEIVRMSPAGGLHGWAAGMIYRSLARHQSRHGGGTALPDNVGFLVDLPSRQSFSPDVAWCHCDPADLDEDFIATAPALAVEIRSPADYTPMGERSLAAKVADYFAAGSLVVWDVDLRDGVIRCYRATTPNQPECFGLGDTADAEPAVPGWRFPVKHLKQR